MKVAMIGLRGIPAKSGGVEVVVENLAPRLVKLGADVTVYCRNEYCEERPESWKGVKLKYLPTINTKTTEALVHSTLSTMNSLFSKYDIVHYHAMGNGMFSIFPRMFGKKSIVTLHGLDYEREKWGLLAKSYLRTSEAMISKFTNHVISCSKKIQDHYKEKYNKDIEFIPNGVNIEVPLPISNLSKYGLKKDNYILFLSRIVPEKGLHFLIEAFKKIKTDKLLAIVGDATHTDSYVDEVKDLAKSDKRIIFTGALHGKDKIEAFSNAYSFVLPSTIEGMPLVLLEAMSYGICPLVSNIQENLDVIEDNAFSFETKKISSLKSQLEYMIENPKEIKSQGNSCKLLVEKKYNWDVIAKQTFDVYKGALK